MRLNRTMVLCFAAVYLIWGSTYFAIVYAIQSIPPWAMSSFRFVTAGLLMTGLAFLKKEEPLNVAEKQYSALSGVFLIFANGVVCVAEKSVSSGLVAVLVGAMPIWIMLLGWAFFGQSRPTGQKMTGALIGLCGVGLIAAGSVQNGSAHEGRGILLLMLSSLAWASGTLVQRRVSGVRSGLRFSARQMLFGAAGTTLVSLMLEQPWRINWAEVSGISWLALLYLVVFGSMIGFTAYSWLSRHVEPHLVSTYALVNPVIAVWLGWLFLSEPVSPAFFTATLLVLAGLTLLMMRPLRHTLFGRRKMLK